MKSVKTIACIFFFLAAISVYGQAPAKLVGLKPAYKFNPYVFYDVVREAGIGCEFSDGSRFSADVRLAYIIPDASAFGWIDANDYFMNRGLDISVFPKWRLKKQPNMYLGLWLSYQDYGYNNRLVKDEYQIAGSFNAASSPPWQGPSSTGYVERSTRSNAFILGATYSIKCLVHSVTIEPFVNVGLGYVSTSGTVTATYGNPPYVFYFNYKVAPYTETNQRLGAYAGLGFKIGLGFGKSGTVSAYDTLISDINKDAGSLEAIVEGLIKKHQLSSSAADHFCAELNLIRRLSNQLIVGGKDPMETQLKIDEKLYALIAYLKDHTFKPDAYVNEVIYTKPNGKQVSFKPFNSDIFDVKDRIQNYRDLVLSESEKEAIFSSFYGTSR